MLHVLVSISLQCIWSSSECGLCGQLDGYNYDGFAPSLKLFSYIYIYIYMEVLTCLHRYIICGVRTYMRCTILLYTSHRISTPAIKMLLHIVLFVMDQLISIYLIHVAL